MPSKEERPAAAERFEGKALLKDLWAVEDLAPANPRLSKDSRQGLRSALGKACYGLLPEPSKTWPPTSPQVVRDLWAGCTEMAVVAASEVAECPLSESMWEHVVVLYWYPPSLRT